MADLGNKSRLGVAPTRQDDFDRAAETLSRERPARHPQLRAAVDLLKNSRFEAAAERLSDFLRSHPRDVVALYLAARAASELQHHEEAESLLARCVEIAPDFASARYARVTELMNVSRPKAAVADADILLEREPNNPMFRFAKASALEALGDYTAAELLWRQLAQDYPWRPQTWERLGHALRAIGRVDECIAACRKQLELDPTSGAGWWNLADLKTFHFEQSDIDKMESIVARADVPASERTLVRFALGKAYCDLKQFDRSFANYAWGNALHHLSHNYDPEVLTDYVRRCLRAFTADFFRRRANAGSPAADPIFIIGMQRSGSTLVEQILASHSQIEGTAELRYLAAIADTIAEDSTTSNLYPAILEALDISEFARLGERYLESTRAHRVLGRPFFIDKMGANFMHVGLIHLVLPNAKIIDVRRHPLACCFANFSQTYVKAVRNLSSLGHTGRYYSDYVRLVTHFDRVLPGKIYRILYEDLVEQPENEIRRLLSFLELPFENGCLEFHRTERVVNTVSAEQVRRPIDPKRVDLWRNYEPWLAPLKSALGQILDNYPHPPNFD